MRFLACLPLLFSLAGCGLLLDVDPPQDGALPDGALPDGLLPDAPPPDGQLPDAGDDAPPFDGGMCNAASDCVSTPACVLDCVGGACVERDENGDGRCDCVEGVTITRSDRCGAIVETCVGGVLEPTRFPSEETCDVADTCGRGTTLYPPASCGVGVCRPGVATSSCGVSCFAPAPAGMLDGCTDMDGTPVDEDCDGRVDEDCDTVACNHTFDTTTPNLRIGLGVNCLIARSEGATACGATNFMSDGAELPDEVVIIGNLRRDGMGAITRCGSVIGGASSATTVRLGGTWRAGTSLRIQDVNINSEAADPVLRGEGVSIHLHGVHLAGDGTAIGTSGGTLEVTGSRVASWGDATIETSDTAVDIAGACDLRAGGRRCLPPTAGALAGLGVHNQGGGVALDMQRGSLRMDASLVTSYAESVRLTDLTSFNVNGSAIVVSSANGGANGDLANVAIDGCDEGSIRESIVVANHYPGPTSRTVAGVRSRDCPLLVVGDPLWTEDITSVLDIATIPRIVALSTGSAREATGLECLGPARCAVRDMAIGGFAPGTEPVGEARGVGIHCEGACVLVNVAAAGNLGRNATVTAIGADLSAPSRIYRSTLLGGNATDATGLSAGGEATVQDSLVVGFSPNRNTDDALGGKGIGVSASQVNGLHSTFAGAPQVANAAGGPIQTACDGVVLRGSSQSVLVSTVVTGGACTTRYGVFIAPGSTLPIMSHVGFGLLDLYTNSDGVNILPLDSPPFHTEVRPFGDAFTTPGGFTLGFRPSADGDLAGAGNPDTATPTDRDGARRPAMPAIGAFEP